jgi:hypothetical protein
MMARKKDRNMLLINKTNNFCVRRNKYSNIKILRHNGMNSIKKPLETEDCKWHNSNNNSRDKTERDTLQTTLPETREHVTHYKKYFQRHGITWHTSNNISRDTTARDTLQTALPETRPHVAHFKQYFQRHDSTWHTSNQFPDTTTRDTANNISRDTTDSTRHTPNQFLDTTTRDTAKNISRDTTDSMRHTPNNTSRNTTARYTLHTILAETHNCKGHFSNPPHTVVPIMQL